MEKDCKQVDILHPLASLHWEECTQLQEKMDNIQCVLVDDTIYVGGGHLSSGHHAQLFSSSSVDLTAWSVMTTPAWYYGLASFNSKVLLVGGKENESCVSNKLWIMQEPRAISKTKWRSFLPPMPTKRYSLSAFGLKQCLIVAGGRNEEDQLLDCVEVLINQQWSVVERLPKPCCLMKPALHNGNCYFIGGQGQGRLMIYCKLSSLLTKVNPSIGKTAGDTLPLWNQFNTPLGYDSVASFGQQLVIMGGIPFTRPYHSKVLVHSPLTQSMIEVAQVPTQLQNVASVVLSKGELVLVGGYRAQWNEKECQRVFRATVKVSPFYPNHRFSMSALSRLEAAGMPVVSSLSEIIEARALPITWRALLDIITDMGLGDLSREVKNYFYGDKSLREQCTAVIMSALVEQIQQNFLAPDELAHGLPAYVPTMTRHSLINNIRAHSQHPRSPRNRSKRRISQL